MMRAPPLVLVVAVLALVFVAHVCVATDMEAEKKTKKFPGGSISVSLGKAKSSSKKKGGGGGDKMISLSKLMKALGKTPKAKSKKNKGGKGGRTLPENIDKAGLESSPCTDNCQAQQQQEIRIRGPPVYSEILGDPQDEYAPVPDTQVFARPPSVLSVDYDPKAGVDVHNGVDFHGKHRFTTQKQHRDQHHHHHHHHDKKKKKHHHHKKAAKKHHHKRSRRRHHHKKEKKHHHHKKSSSPRFKEEETSESRHHHSRHHHRSHRHTRKSVAQPRFSELVQQVVDAAMSEVKNKVRERQLSAVGCGCNVCPCPKRELESDCGCTTCPCSSPSRTSDCGCDVCPCPAPIQSSCGCNVCPCPKSVCGCNRCPCAPKPKPKCPCSTCPCPQIVPIAPPPCGCSVCPCPVASTVLVNPAAAPLQQSYTPRRHHRRHHHRRHRRRHDDDDDVDAPRLDWTPPGATSSTPIQVLQSAPPPVHMSATPIYTTTCGCSVCPCAAPGTSITVLQNGQLSTTTVGGGGGGGDQANRISLPVMKPIPGLGPDTTCPGSACHPAVQQAISAQAAVDSVVHTKNALHTHLQNAQQHLVSLNRLSRALRYQYAELQQQHQGLMKQIISAQSRLSGMRKGAGSQSQGAWQLTASLRNINALEDKKLKHLVSTLSQPAAVKQALIKKTITNIQRAKLRRMQRSLKGKSTKALLSRAKHNLKRLKKRVKKKAKLQTLKKHVKSKRWQKKVLKKNPKTKPAKKLAVKVLKLVMKARKAHGPLKKRLLARAKKLGKKTIAVAKKVGAKKLAKKVKKLTRATKKAEKVTAKK